jgi:hypothetical protein
MSASQPARRGPRLRVLGIVLGIGGLLTALAPPAVSAQAGTAPDLAPWQRAEAPFTPTDLQLWDVIAGGPGFIAVGGGFEAEHEVGTAAIWVSEDGRTWKSVALLGDASTGIPRSITVTPDGFVVVGSGCCPDRAAVWLSADGLTCERLPDQPGFADTAMLGVTWADDHLTAVGCSAQLECFGGLSWTSPDGRTWSQPVALESMPGDVSSTSAGTFALGSSESYEGSAVLSAEVGPSAWSAPSTLAPLGWLETAVDAPQGTLVAGGTTNQRNGRAVTLAFTSPDGFSWEPLDGKGLEGIWVEDIASSPSGWLLAGWSANRNGQLPATLWTTDLATFDPIPFPHELKEGGTLHAGAIAADGSTMVIVGSTILNRGEVPTAWVRDAGEAAAADRPAD